MTGWAIIGCLNPIFVKQVNKRNKKKGVTVQEGSEQLRKGLCDGI